MAAATVLDVWKVPIVDRDDLHVHVIPLFGICEGGEFISGVIVRLLGQSQGQISGHM